MIWLLLVLYQIKHFVCDYPLQGKYMLGKFKGGNEWILPLLAHAGVHGVATLLIALAVGSHHALSLAFFDMTIHFTMDRIKASPNLLGRFKPLTAQTYMAAVKANDQAALKGNTYFWWSLGLDQGVHHLTHYAIIWFLIGGLHV